MFLDRIRLTLRAGDGGRGALSFRREAHVPRGGPDGGDGGKGGDVVLLVDGSLTTLSEFRFKRVLDADAGGDGGGKKRSGKAGGDLVVRIPQGTLATDRRSGETIADLVVPGEEIVICRGGRGGRGNARFATSVRRAPRIAEDGGRGEEREVELELKLLADVGLLGLPNAGKSTLLAALTRARPKIADYPFTTLSPNLGVARLEDRELVVADIPGLIEGASRGAGLGEEFLRHIERTRLLVHLVDASLRDPVADIATIEAELAAYGKGLVDRPRLIALNKIDLPEARRRLHQLRARLSGHDVVAISAATGEGVAALQGRIFAGVPDRPAPAVPEPKPRRIAFAGEARDWSVARDGEAYRVRHERLERLAARLDWDSPEAAAYFQRLLARSGVERELRSLGVREGDTVRIGSVELEWQE